MVETTEQIPATEAPQTDSTPAIPLDTKLEHGYTVWAMVKQQKNNQTALSEQYVHDNKQVAHFETVGQFWHVQSHFRRPAVMPIGTFLHFFIDGVKPLWEDEHCKDGGAYKIRMPKTHTAKYWEDLLLALVGEQFDAESGEVLGLVLSSKFNSDVVSIWHKTANSEETRTKLKASIEAILQLEDGMKLDYENFQEVLSAPPREPKQPRGGYRGRGRGGRGGNFQSRTEESNEFDRKSQPAHKEEGATQEQAAVTEKKEE